MLVCQGETRKQFSTRPKGHRTATFRETKASARPPFRNALHFGLGKIRHPRTAWSDAAFRPVGYPSTMPQSTLEGHKPSAFLRYTADLLQTEREPTWSALSVLGIRCREPRELFDRADDCNHQRCWSDTNPYEVICSAQPQRIRVWRFVFHRDTFRLIYRQISHRDSALR